MTTKTANPVAGKTRSTKNLTVAEYIDLQIAASGKSQFLIAEECGFAKPNIITMIKQGKTKLPLAKVGLMAQALSIDPLHLFKMVMSEYEPDTWEMISDMILKQPFVTKNEMAIIEVVRESSAADPKIRTDEDRLRILNAVSTLKPGDDD